MLVHSRARVFYRRPCLGFVPGQLRNLGRFLSTQLCEGCISQAVYGPWITSQFHVSSVSFTSQFPGTNTVIYLNF